MSFGKRMRCAPGGITETTAFTELELIGGYVRDELCADYY